MSNEQTNQPNRAQQIRTSAAAMHKDFSDAFTRIFNDKTHATDKDFQQELGLTLAWGISVLAEIAAELAEANSRDREAEIRAKNAEVFVAGIQAELARQGVIIPGGMASVKPARGR